MEIICPICKKEGKFFAERIMENLLFGILNTGQRKANFYKCNFCKTIFQYPLPDEKELAKIYNNPLFFTLNSPKKNSSKKL